MKLKYIIVVLIMIILISGNATAGITYDSVTNIITVTGYTEASPCTFTMLYNADVAGGWGVVGRQCTNQFCFDSRLEIGDGTTITWFIDTNKHIVFADGVVSSGNRAMINVKNNGTFRLGTQYLNTYTTVNGCTLLSKESYYNHYLINIDSGRVDLFSCCVSSESPSPQCMIKGSVFGTYINPDSIMNIFNLVSVRVQFENCVQANIYNIYISHTKYGISSLGPNINNVVIQRSSVTPLQLYRMNQSLTIKNLKIEDTIGYYSIRCEIVSGDVYLINCNFDKWVFRWKLYPLPKVYRQYTFNLETTPNAEITIYNNTTVVYNEFADVNGIISEQILTMGHYLKSTDSILNSQNPYRLVISKPGYQTYTNTFNLTEPIIWNIGLEPERIPLDKSGIVTGLGFLIGCLVVSLGLIIMKRREFL